jgi:hypothetical protein
VGIKYVVSGPTRVGGNLLTGIIKSCGARVVHTHNPLLEFGNYSKVVLIIVNRRDRFAALMSNCVAWHTGQTTTYNRTKVEPFLVTPEAFIQQYVDNIYQNQKHDLTRNYQSVNMFWYEDFVNNYEHVTKRLKLKMVSPLAPDLVPAPYNYKDLIINYQDLRKIFEQLEIIYQNRCK